MPDSGDRPSFLPWLVLSLGICAVSSGAIFAKMAEAPGLVTAAWRVGLAALILLPLVIWKGRKEIAALPRASIGLSVLAGFFLAIHFATWISSLQYTSVANSVVLVNTNPLWVALLMPWLVKESVSPKAWAGIALSFSGALVIGLSDVGTGSKALLGDGLALLGGLSLSFYLLFGRKVRPSLSLISYVGLCYGSAAIFLWIAVLISGLPFTGFPAGTWGAFFGLAIVSQILGHSSYNWALRHFTASFIAMALLAEPVLCSLAAWIFFGEAITLRQACGNGLILAGIVLAAQANQNS
ncbi:MAG: hypothetical protein RL095_838 [Verrucomicrobiota bacterium]|jgi:drug/metabolite transporter (DMT)-like permease